MLGTFSNPDGPLPIGDGSGISCLMVTRGRYEQPLVAIETFRAQAYANRELVVIDDNDDPRLAETIAALRDPRIRVLRTVERGRTLGHLRNLAVAAARGAFVCTWDDDDLHDPRQLDEQMRVLLAGRAEACVLARLFIWWPFENRLALSSQRLWEPTLLCRKAVLPPYPAIERGEDMAVMGELRRSVPIAVLNSPQLYVYTFHQRNTWERAHFEKFWREAERRFDGDDYRTLLPQLEARLSMESYRHALAERDRVANTLTVPIAPPPVTASPITMSIQPPDRPREATRARVATGGASVGPPRFLFMQVNKRCNLRCQHCDFWRLNDKDRVNYLSWDRKRDIVGEFAEMNPSGAVVICGGESMLDLDDYFMLTGECRARGLKAISVVNGTRIRDDALADRMILEGPHEISVSLNSHREDLHDETRGVAGAFRKSVEALQLLIAARRRHPDRGTRIYVMGLIFDRNYRDLAAFYDFVLNDIGADKLKLNFLQPSFGQAGPEDAFFAAHARMDPEELGRIIDACNVRYGLGLNPVWRRQVEMYARSLHRSAALNRGWADATGTIEHICNTYERNLMVDHYGIARLCFSPDFPGAALQRRGDLRRFWDNADPIRANMRQCNRYCGISHSVRREHSTLRSTPKPEG